MIPELELDTYAQVVRLLAHKMTVREFRCWFDEITSDEPIWETPSLGRIELLFAELTSGHRTETELLEELKAVFYKPTFVLRTANPAGRPIISTGTEASLESLPKLSAMAAILGQAVGR